MTDPRTEIRRRIVRRLNTDEWMERHFGIAAHAEDVADAVMELFDSEITESWEVRGTSPEWGDEEWTSYPKDRVKALGYVEAANAKDGSTARAYRVLELRTVPEPIQETQP